MPTSGAETRQHRRSPTTAILARNAGISEPILYAHFSSKEGLFRAAVEENVQGRLRALRAVLARIPRRSPVHCIERMALRFPKSRSGEMLSTSFVQDAVHACLAYGFWLAALRYTAKAASPRVRRFAGRVALVTLLARS